MNAIEKKCFTYTGLSQLDFHQEISYLHKSSHFVVPKKVNKSSLLYSINVTHNTLTHWEHSLQNSLTMKSSKTLKFPLLVHCLSCCLKKQEVQVSLRKQKVTLMLLVYKKREEQEGHHMLR